jgi:ornithine cyclodeaminase
MNPIYIDYLNAFDIEALDLSNDEILGAIETSLGAQGRHETVIEPRVHLEPDASFHGHFNVLRGYVAPLGLAGIKVVGDFVDNYKLGYPSEFGVLNLFDPRTGVPKAILDATAITDMRTGAVTAMGAKHLARKGSKVLGHIGARGTAYWNVRLLDHLFDFDEIRVHSRRPESRDAFGAKLAADLGKKITVTDNWRDCVEGADIVVEASRLNAPEPMLKTEWIKKGAFVVPYGTMSAIELSLTDIMDKLVVDDWGQCKGGKFGSLRAHVEAGKLSEQTLHAELGQIVAGLKPGRQNDEETILLWHRGLSLSDIALGSALLEKAKAANLGQRLRFA